MKCLFCILWNKEDNNNFDCLFLLELKEFLFRQDLLNNAL